jgi:hypothetical protein
MIPYPLPRSSHANHRSAIIFGRIKQQQPLTIINRQRLRRSSSSIMRTSTTATHKINEPVTQPVLRRAKSLPVAIGRVDTGKALFWFRPTTTTTSAVSTKYLASSNWMSSSSLKSTIASSQPDSTSKRNQHNLPRLRRRNQEKTPIPPHDLKMPTLDEAFCTSSSSDTTAETNILPMPGDVDEDDAWTAYSADDDEEEKEHDELRGLSFLDEGRE